MDDWRKVIWSDESKFLIFNHARSTRVWRKVSEKYKVDCLVPTVKSNANGVMVWGCFRGGEVGPLAMVDGTIDSDGYIKILEENLIQWLPDFLDEDDAYFQDDNAPIHRSHKVRSWKERNGLLSLPWPAQSPDLNPIEHLWDELERRVRKRPHSMSNVQCLKEALIEEWKMIPSSVCEKLVISLVDRVKAVLQSKGNPTEY